MRAGDVVGVFDVREDETLVQGYFINLCQETPGF